VTAFSWKQHRCRFDEVRGGGMHFGMHCVASAYKRNYSNALRVQNGQKITMMSIQHHTRLRTTPICRHRFRRRLHQWRRPATQHPLSSALLRLLHQHECARGGQIDVNAPVILPHHVVADPGGSAAVSGVLQQ
jgi:hypothetical protein